MHHPCKKKKGLFCKEKVTNPL